MSSLVTGSVTDLGVTGICVLGGCFLESVSLQLPIQRLSSEPSLLSHLLARDPSLLGKLVDRGLGDPEVVGDLDERHHGWVGSVHRVPHMFAPLWRDVCRRYYSILLVIAVDARGRVSRLRLAGLRMAGGTRQSAQVRAQRAALLWSLEAV